ncbi:VirB4 family type IV secretion/conjugal transfer ATPase [Paracraurococcus lichenis]|uniref:CagE TrbE VirB component of type IV transporter system central domain-containing protein n=1 Tax=Paracraurococcus lichenis TaxID=3064888 RepID=A0ABT9E6H1_9PROT|nr:hypothetical protein [Paracraurococcus sp. LOR1-02]MDO9711782.1 hypothetical protein [Paracraurococcus sp. LOR1-02]
MPRHRADLAHWIPIEDTLSPTARLLRGGHVHAAFEADGVHGDTADALTIARCHSGLNTVLRNLRDSHLIIKVALVRTHADPATWPHQRCTIPFIEDVTHAYRDRLLDRRLYENRLFITLEYRAGKAVPGMSQAEQTTQERLDLLERACTLLQASLADYGLRRLGLVEREVPGGRQVFDEVLEAAALIATGLWRPVGMTRGRPGDVVLTEDVVLHHEHLELRSPGSTTYAAGLTFREYPARTYPGILNGLLAAPFRFSLVHSFRFLEPAEGQGIITRKQNKMLWAGDKAASQIAGLVLAADQLQSGEFVMGEHAMTLCVFADRAGTGSALYDRILNRVRDAVARAGLPAHALDVFDGAVQDAIGRPDSNPLSDVVNAAWQLLGATGCTVARESRALMGTWLSMLPGNDQLHPRSGAITSLNFAGFCPLLGYARGPRLSRWGKPIAVTVSPGGTPYHYHWYDGTGDSAVGNTLVTGWTGSAKSGTTGFLALCTVARVWENGGGWIGLDHKRGWNALTLAMGGSYSILGDGEPALAPMRALPNTARTREFLNTLLRGCILQGGTCEITPEEEYRLELGIATVMENHPEHRWIREVQAFLGDHPDGAGARLRKWCWGEELGWVLDAPVDRVDMSRDINCFDTTRLLANERARGPAMFTLFFRIEQRLDGRPLLITVDEGWYVLMESTVFAPAMEKISRTIRSKNGVLVFITQSPADPVRAGLGAALVEQFPNQMHFSNPKARREDYRALSLTDGEFDAIMGLQKGTGAFLLRKGTHSSIQCVPLAGLDDALAILSVSEANLEAIDSMAEEDRSDPIRFQAEFHRRRKAIAARLAREQQRQVQEEPS